VQVDERIKRAAEPGEPDEAVADETGTSADGSERGRFAGEGPVLAVIAVGGVLGGLRPAGNRTPLCVVAEPRLLARTGWC
jgi:hypothetical protein